MPPQVVTVRNASKVAAALSNEKCQRILDYLTKHKDATESQISKDLTIPLSTVHYNMKVLSEANLVMDDVYTYSAKGKEVTHYRLNKNPIVIVQEENQYMDLMKAIMPAAVLAAGAAIIWKLAQHAPTADFYAAPEARSMMVEEAAGTVADDAANTMMMKAAETTQAAPPDFLPYFFAGVIVTLVLSFILLSIYSWWSKRHFS